MPRYTFGRAADDRQSPLYEAGVGCLNEYAVDPGVCVLPVAEDPPASETALRTWSPVVVLRLHAPYRVRKFRYDVPRKQNNPPVVPSPGDTGNFVYIGGTITFSASLNTTLRNFDWGVRSDYLFVENNVSRTKDGFVLGTPPWTWVMSEENAQGLGGVGQPPQVGAIAAAGTDPVVAWRMGENINLADPWGYNMMSYFPPAMFNNDIANGGRPVQQVNQNG